MNSASRDIRCSICGTIAIDDLPLFHHLHRITSDCRPWPPGGRLGVCRSCNAVQKPADSGFLADTEAIYRSYSIYHQGGGAEQSVFQSTSGLSASRSAQLLDRFHRRVPLLRSGRFLDIGCGNGATLRAFGDLRPDWIKCGTEFDARHAGAIAEIPNTLPLHTGPLDDLPSVFDVITMVHVLEHLPDPVAWLASLRHAIAANGVLLIEVPYHAANPFDLVIADHRTHFTAVSLEDCLHRAGYDVMMLSTDWIPRELSAVARPANNEVPSSTPEDATAVRTRVSDALRWLRGAADSVNALGATGELGIFGTSIAGTWLASQAHTRIAFFVDEDSQRIGRVHLGRPVLAPQDVPQGSHVYVGLPTDLARAIGHRLARPGITFVTPT